MLNLMGKIKLYDRRFCSFSSAPKYFLHLNQFSSSAANAPKPNSENSNQDSSSAIYLKSRYGFSPKRALSYPNKHPKFGSHQGPDSVIAFLKRHRFNDSRISVIVRKWPLVFQHVPETSFLPKFKFFRSLGFSSSDIVKILTLAPSLLGRNLDDQIIPRVDFLKSFLSSDKDFVSSIVRSPRILAANLQDTLLPNVGILREVGVPESHIAEFLKISPFAMAADPESFRATVVEVQKLDLDPQKKNFIIGIIVMREISISVWKEKIDLYKRWGWSDDQLKDAFRKNPRMLAASKDKITRIHDLLINKMGCDLTLLITRPLILMLGFEKTIAPRCAYYQVLLSKGLIEQGFSFGHMLTCPKWLFLGRYVRPFAKKDPELFKL